MLDPDTPLDNHPRAWRVSLDSECRELQKGIASIGRQSWEGQASDSSVRIALLNIATALCEKGI